MAGNRSDWEVVGKPLGEGGQSNVYLVRGPARLNAKSKDIEQIFSFNPWGTSMAETRARLTREFADAVVDYGRADSPAELGALKEFKLRGDEQQAISRLAQEIEVLQENRPGLPRLLDFNLTERWMVTEYFPGGTAALL
jgi:serine/threonine protein kinase